MPTSHPEQLTQIVNLIKIANPQNVLEIGPGFGTYGVLTREYLDLCDGREKYSDWKRKIDCIEIFPKYLTPIHKFIYNRIFIGDARKIVPKLHKKYDLTLLIDVIEHLNQKDGQKLLKDILKKSKNIIISTPIKMDIQGDAFGNPHESHLYQWNRYDFRQFKNKFFVRNNLSLICFIGHDAKNIKQQIQKEKTKLFFKKYFFFIYPIYKILKNK